jgi:hypothetical protein
MTFLNDVEKTTYLYQKGEKAGFKNGYMKALQDFKKNLKEGKVAFTQDEMLSMIIKLKEKLNANQ